MKRYSPLFLFVFILVFISLGCQISTSLPREAAPVIVVTPPASAALPDNIPDLEYQDTLLTSLYDKVNPGIVSIQVLSDAGGALGSGFVFDKEGDIVTNYHVVEGANELEVDFPSGLKVRGKVIGKDLDSDIAVVNVKAPAEALFPLEMGDSDQLKVGQSVIAIGNPFGLTSSMTTGIVSAIGRTSESMRQSPEGNFFSTGGLIQTDAAINPGNSGGPLLDLKGRVMGINREIRTNSMNSTGEPTNSGIGFAVPVNIVKRVVPVLIQKGNYDYPYLGISFHNEISLIEQEALGLPQATGAYVLDVASGGPAEKAGLIGATRQTSLPNLPVGGDLIIAIDDRPVRVFGDLITYLMANKSPGDTVKLTILRDNQQKEVELTLEKRP
jgi:S1-C subfamily serine protease